MDHALPPLIPALRAAGRCLWLADEQIDAAAVATVAPPVGLAALTNRCDVQSRLRSAGCDAALSDFDFSPWATGSLDRVVYRISKEKALVHHLINGALERLRPGGELWLGGGKGEGIKTYIEKAASRAGREPVISRAGSVWLGVIERGDGLGEPLPDQDYAMPRQLELAPGLSLWSKPGIYGWQKEDLGSALLIEHLGAVWPTAPARVLDLGCGYGYLTARAAQRWPAAEFTATDNNVAAAAACARNLAELGIRGRAQVADCGEGIDGPFDALLCNPPFHQGFEVEGELGERFLRAAARLLAPNGRALFVVNQFIPLERRAGAYFGRAEVVARNRSFKLVAVAR